MVDIAKCKNEDCPLKKKCYRYTAKSGFWQSYMAFKYDKGCDSFIDNSIRN